MTSRKRLTRAKAEETKQTLREELDAILMLPIAQWTGNQLDRVEELASLLGYSDEDCYWRS